MLALLSRFGMRATLTVVLGLATTGLAIAQDTPDPSSSAPSSSHPIRYTASLDGLQSVAVNSTALETRVGTGSASVLFDPLTGDLSYDIQFQGLIADDITLGDPAVNPDGTMPAPGTINGNSLPGGGLFLLHFHVGARGANGPIPVDIVARGGPAVGVISTDPTPIQGAPAGRVVGMVNIFDLAMDGILLNNVPADGRDDGVRNATCTQCGLIEAFLQNDVYVNIHTFNNPFGEIRGQLMADGCGSVFINTVTGLQTAIGQLSNTERNRGLAVRATLAQRLLDRGRNDRARGVLSRLVQDVVERGERDRLSADETSTLTCAVANILTTLPGDSD